MSDPHDDRDPPDDPGTADDGRGRSDDPDSSVDRGHREEVDGSVGREDFKESAGQDDQADRDRPSSGRHEESFPVSHSTDRGPGRQSPPQDRNVSTDTSDTIGPSEGIANPDVESRSADPSRRSPPPKRQSASGGTSRFRGVLGYAYDIASSVLIVVMIGALLFATSGVWPPLVAIESASMEPHIDTGDLVFVMDEQRFPGPGAIEETGVVPARAAEETGYRTFDGYGDVVIFKPGGDEGATPIIHRAMLWVEEGENWYDRGDSTAIGNADSCAELANCPAPHAGFITKGDNTVTNKRYDQARSISEPVRPEWIVGTAEYGVPGLGQVRLLSGEVRSERVPQTVNSTTGVDLATSPGDTTEAVDTSASAP